MLQVIFLSIDAISKLPAPPNFLPAFGGDDEGGMNDWLCNNTGDYNRPTAQRQQSTCN